MSSAEAASFLGIHPLSIQKLIYSGALPAEKIANRWLIERDDLSEFAKTYNPSRGRPRTGDYNAVKKGKVGKRMGRRVSGKATGKAMRKLFK